jgi:hypothetical protein
MRTSAKSKKMFACKGDLSKLQDDNPSSIQLILVPVEFRKIRITSLWLKCLAKWYDAAAIINDDGFSRRANEHNF